jgi:hypothetical protein
MWELLAVNCKTSERTSYSAVMSGGVTQHLGHNTKGDTTTSRREHGTTTCVMRTITSQVYISVSTKKSLNTRGVENYIKRSY